jgi:hypothetical protein
MSFDISREREVLLLLRALRDEVDCYPLGLSLHQLKWNQQQQQRARAAGIVIVASHTSRDILKSPSEPLALLQTLAPPPPLRAPSIGAANAAAIGGFEYHVTHPCSSAYFPCCDAPSLLRYVCVVELIDQSPTALAAAVGCLQSGTRVVLQGSYRGGFYLRSAGVCLQGVGTAIIHGDGNKNTICISAANCLITGLHIAHARHHALCVTGSSCLITHCKLTDASYAAIGVFGSASVDVQGCWLGQRCTSGVYVTDRGRANLSDCVVSLCFGAGLRCSGSSTVTATGCCVVLTRKAGVLCEQRCTVSLSDCTLLRNAHGGAFVVDNAHITMLKCRQSPSSPHSVTVSFLCGSYRPLIVWQQNRSLPARRRVVQRHRCACGSAQLSHRLQQDELPGLLQRRHVARGALLVAVRA